MDTELELGAAGASLIKEFEKLSLAAYPDVGGVPTIGWGHTEGVQMGDTCTEEQAEAWFLSDTQWACRVINKNVAPQLNQNQFDALVSFVFNVGVGRLNVKPGFLIKADGTRSTLLAKLNIPDYEAAAGQMGRFVNCNGKAMPGLIRRRGREIELFQTAP